MGPRKPDKSNEDQTDYLAKRSRNNEAVRRSREKARCVKYVYYSVSSIIFTFVFDSYKIVSQNLTLWY